MCTEGMGNLSGEMEAEECLKDGDSPSKIEVTIANEESGIVAECNDDEFINKKDMKMPCSTRCSTDTGNTGLLEDDSSSVAGTVEENNQNFRSNTTTTTNTTSNTTTSTTNNVTDTATSKVRPTMPPRRSSQIDFTNDLTNNRLKSLEELKAIERKKQRNKYMGLRWLRKTRARCGAIVNNQTFQLFIILLIVINSVMLGLATFPFSDEYEDLFETVDKSFLIIFTVELVLQFTYHGVRLFLDGWLFMDFFVVVMSWSLNSVSVFRSFRIFRAIRLISRLGALKEIIRALLQIIPDMGAIAALLLLIIYIYAVMCTVLWKNLYPEHLDFPYFSRLDKSFFTLFQLLTLDTWNPIARDIRDVTWWSWIVVTSYLLISSFMLYSLVAAVLCKAVMLVDHPDNDKKDPMDEKIHTLQSIRRTKKIVRDLKRKQVDLLKRIELELEKLNEETKQEQEMIVKAEIIVESKTPASTPSKTIAPTVTPS